MSEVLAPVLNEHQNARNLESKDNPAGYEPTPEEKQALSLVQKLFEKARTHRKQYDEKWLDYYKFFRGRQWKEQRPSYRHSEVINMVFQNIQAVIPILTDARPRLEFIAQSPQNVELAQILNDVAASDWESNNWLQVYTEILYDAHFYGVGLGAMEFDPKALFGAGATRFESCDPLYFFPDPEAWDVNDRRGNFMIYAEPQSVERLKIEYPHVADFLKPDVIDLATGNKTVLDQVHFKSPVDNRTTLEGTSAYDVENKSQALKITCWLKSEEFIEEEVKETTPNGEERSKFVQKLKYPKGRRITIVGGVVCEDIENPYEDGKFPFSRLPNYLLPREFWGISEVEQLMGPQKVFNKLVSFALDVLTLMGNPVWVVDSTSGVDTDNLFNRPGLVIEKEKGSEVRREEGVQLQPFVLQLIDRMKVWFDDISGSNDVSRGVKPGSAESGIAIQSLQEAAQTRLRQKSRNMDAFLQNIGKQWLARQFQFSSAPRMVRISHDDGAQKYFRFHVETHPETDEAGNPRRTVNFTPFVQDERGQYAESMPQQMAVEGEFDVRVGTGSSLPFAKTEKTNLSLQLFKLAAIDRRELLKNVDYPNWEAVADRMDQLDQQAAQAQAAQGPH